MSKDWDIAQTENGARRVVASPLPMRILDLDVIRALVSQRAIVICGGGGGIPVVKKGDHFVGVPAVVDKDRLSALLAIKLQADALIISTAVDAIRTDFGNENEVVHLKLTVDEVMKYMAEGEFPSGSMGPKVASLAEAAVHVPGLLSVLCQPGDALGALRGQLGTTITNQ
jgi:carbamate kinase